MNQITMIILCLAFASCSQKQDNNILPRYSDMGAAEDAGNVK
jgi:hypothetical protein